MAVNYTNEGLVKHAEAALKLKTKYMWGGVLRSITQGYIKTLRGIYGVDAAKGYTESRYKELAGFAGKGYYGSDCVGLIKSYYWSGREDGGTGSPNYGAKGFPDVNAGMMYSAAKVKGPISTLPERAGLVLHCKTHPHVGIYVGNGEVIECTLSKRGDGVVRTKLKDFTWEYWLECPYIGYEKAEETIEARLAFPAVVRSEARSSSMKLTRLGAGTRVSVVKGSAKKDEKSGLVYVRLSAGGWIVESALGK